MSDTQQFCWQDTDSLLLKDEGNHSPFIRIFRSFGGRVRRLRDRQHEAVRKERARAMTRARELWTWPGRQGFLPTG